MNDAETGMDESEMEVIKLAGLVDPRDGAMLLEDYHFEQKVILGPAMLIAIDGYFEIEGCTFGAGSTPETVIPDVFKPEAFDGPGASVDGVIGMKRCSFRRCVIYGVSLVAPPGGLDQMRAGIG